MIESNGKQGSRTLKEIEINLREEPIVLDDIEHTPRYLEYDM